MQPADWPSLIPQVDLADRFFGPRGAKLLSSWFATQISRVDDPAFARLFSNYIDLSGVVQGDYSHRLIHTSNGKLLGGIRYYGQDTARPFVEIIAHDFTNWDALRDCVAQEWSRFAPTDLRVLVSPDMALPFDARIDKTVFAARCSQMAPPDGRVSLAPFACVEEAIEIVVARYQALSEEQPNLARNISAVEPDDLRQWHEHGALCAVALEVGGTSETVGLFAASPGTIEWIEGDEINEEVISKPYSGRGLAASAQAAWATRPDLDTRRLLIGTIDHGNVASRRSAIRAGRQSILNYVFLPLDDLR